MTKLSYRDISKFETISIAGGGDDAIFDKNYFIEFAVLTVLSEFRYGGYYHGAADRAKFDNIFGNDRLLKIWNQFPGLRGNLFKTIITKLSTDKSYTYSCTKLPPDLSSIVRGQCEVIAMKIYKSIEDSFSPEASKIKLALETALDMNFDHLSIIKAIESDDPNSLSIDLWIQDGLMRSHSSAFFDHVYFSVKREPGATDKKIEIIRRASISGSLSDKIILAIAKSAPISLKREVIRHLIGVMSGELHTPAHVLRKEIISDTDKIILDEAESKAMLFAPIQDEEIQRLLLPAISTDNLVWLIPAISSMGNKWLSRDLENRLNQEAS